MAVADSPHRGTSKDHLHLVVCLAPTLATGPWCQTSLLELPGRLWGEGLANSKKKGNEGNAVDKGLLEIDSWIFISSKCEMGKGNLLVRIG
jgi:hypothetical protein